VIVVGDIDTDRAIAGVAKTLGALPARADVKEPKGLRAVKFAAPTPEPVVRYHTGPKYQALVAIAWPTTDALANRRETHAAAVLSTIMQSRAIAQLRNAEGKTYSPNGFSDFSMALPGYGSIGAVVQVEPAEVPGVFAEFDAIAADLAEHEVTPDEFQRALRPRIGIAERNRLSNSFWLRYLAGAQADPRRLDFAVAQAAEVKAVTAADVQAVARKWLVKAKSWRMAVLPKP